MKAVTLRRLMDLRSAMDEDPRVLALAEAEKALMADPALAPLLEEKEAAQTAYLSARLEYGENDEKTFACQKRLYQAKLALDLHPSAKEYSLRFAEVNGMLRNVDAILFGDFREPLRCGGKHD